MTIVEMGKAAELFGFLASTHDGVASVGPDLRVLDWNTGATRILGYSSDDARGRACYEIFQGSDRCGNVLCGADCPALAGLRRGELAPTRDLLARDSSGRKVWLSLTTVVPPFAYRDECLLVHVFRETALPPELERLVAERLFADRPPADRLPADHSPADRLPGNRRPSALAALSPREREVLCLLGRGAGTTEIARRLFISPATARNHVQHILARLGVSSRLEAVTLALRDHSFASDVSGDDDARR